MVEKKNEHINITLFSSIKKASDYINNLYKDKYCDIRTTYVNIYNSSIGKGEKAYGYYWFKIGKPEIK